MSDERKWWFVSNLNAGDDGFNDAGIETFNDDQVQSMVREVIQNSIDQHVGTKPVIVEFDDFEISNDTFPGYNQFSEILQACLSQADEERVEHYFYNRACSVLQQPIKVLRISDFNTTGLIGADTGETNLPWHNLVKAKGSSNKENKSGGSFGIGKSAPFACSKLRTVFYGSKVDDVESYVGVSRLSSFDFEDSRRVGTGFYAESNSIEAILEPFNLNNFKRTENGTDVYICGFDSEGDILTQIKEATLTNFFISIHKGYLEVKYKDLIITKKNLGQHIASLDDKQFLDYKNYYGLLNSVSTANNTDFLRISLDSSKFGEKYGIQDHECVLLLKREEDLNRRILITRKIGMSLFEMGNISGSISFTGILMIEGDTMNKIFKQMESPEHKAWKPTRTFKDKNFYVDAHNDLKKYIKDKVISNFSQVSESSIVAFNLDDFFVSEDSLNESGKQTEETLNSIPEITLITTKVSSKTQSALISKKGLFGKDDNEELIDGSTDDDFKPKEKDEQSNQNNPTEKKESSKKYSKLNIKKRLMVNKNSSSDYTLSITLPNKKKFIKLEFFGKSESGTLYPLDLINPQVEGNAKLKSSFYGNYMEIEKNNKVTKLNIKFSLPFKKYCMMEVFYYEAK